ncbi:MAG: putative baseplate assembly protein [Pyrinomonadaceae bacterium]|nr:putative baseplate assembly protein [Pyrinomonadaceae bacterium]
MISEPTITLDARNAEEFVNQLLVKRLGYVPEWQPQAKGVDTALAGIFARYLYAIVQRLNQAPEKNKLAFLDLLGLSLVPAQPARAPIVFEIAPTGPDSQAPVNTQVAAPPPPGSSDQIVFETERTTGLAAARLKEVVSLWPGRDQYLDHSSAFLAAQPFQPFLKRLLVDTPHAIYLAHDTILALAGEVTVDVEFELTQASAEQLSLLWQYWDGKVWRGFKSARAACSEKEFKHADSTNGFTNSGKFRLEADCAETKKTAVDGVEAFWIRGLLTEPLVDRTKPLPIVETIQLSTVIQRELRATLDIDVEDTGPSSSETSILANLANEAGEKLSGLSVKITDPFDPNFPEQVMLPHSTEAGRYDVNIEARQNYEVKASFPKLEATGRARNLDLNRVLTAKITFNVQGLDPDKAFADGTKLDLTKPFYPFGQQPQPGSVFYFNSEEVFSKVNATMQVYVAKTATPLDSFDIPTTTTGVGNQTKAPLEHLIAWEYWNGRKWATLFETTSFADTEAEVIDFGKIPYDMTTTKVNEEEGLWMRARLVRGGYGFSTNVPSNAGGAANSFTYVISQPPALAAFRIGYGWSSPREHAEQVRTYNDFKYEDHTYDAKWPGATFAQFTVVSDLTPALYLGFDKKLPVDDIGLYFDIVEQKGETRGPALLWEYFDGSAWQELSFDDETRNLRLPGIFSFIAAEDSKPLARFGTELHFIRGRLKEDGPPGEPTVNGIFPNAVWATQHRTLNDTPLGASNGLPNQVFRFTQIPVLAGERVEVRELSGPRANVEWRILALEIASGDAGIIRESEDLLGREGLQTDIVKGDLRLRRDKNKKVAEAWVTWKERPHFFVSGPDDRHYVIDRARGLVFFGDGVRGRIPEPGSQILSRQHRSGGGLAGNVAAGAIKQLLGAISGVQGVSNPRAAEGGADGETIEKFGLRGPQTIRHRGRAISPSDYETLAREASPAVAVARAIATRSAGGQNLPGWVTLVIIPQSDEPCPWPSFGLRQHVLAYIEARAPADVVAANQIHITGPDYVSIDVRATLTPKIASEAGVVEKRARQALQGFLHPLRGGPDRTGWSPGRGVYLSDVAAVLERVEGIDYVKDLALLVNGTLHNEQVTIADDRVVVAGKLRLKLEAAER